MTRFAKTYRNMQKTTTYKNKKSTEKCLEQQKQLRSVEDGQKPPPIHQEQKQCQPPRFTKLCYGSNLELGSELFLQVGSTKPPPPQPTTTMNSQWRRQRDNKPRTTASNHNHQDLPTTTDNATKAIGHRKVALILY